MDLELELALLTLADAFLDNDYETSLSQAQSIGAMELDEEEYASIKEVADNLFVESKSKFTKDQIKNIIEAFNIPDDECYKVYVLFAFERLDGMDVKEFKATEAYNFINTEDPQFKNEVDKFRLIRIMATAAISIRDKELIKFMLEKVQKYNA